MFRAKTPKRGVGGSNPLVGARITVTPLGVTVILIYERIRIISVQPGGLYIHQFKKLVNTFISFSPCEKEMQANPLVGANVRRSLLHSVSAVS